jgi:hypothetical protein
MEFSFFSNLDRPNIQSPMADDFKRMLFVGMFPLKCILVRLLLKSHASIAIHFYIRPIKYKQGETGNLSGVSLAYPGQSYVQE